LISSLFITSCDNNRILPLDKVPDNKLNLPYPQKIEMIDGLFRINENFTEKEDIPKYSLKKITERFLARNS